MLKKALNRKETPPMKLLEAIKKDFLEILPPMDKTIRNFKRIFRGLAPLVPVSYTHLTLPTNREV